MPLGGSLKKDAAVCQYQVNVKFKFRKLKFRKSAACASPAFPHLHLLPPPSSTALLLPPSPSPLLCCPSPSLQTQTPKPVFPFLVLLQRRCLVFHLETPFNFYSGCLIYLYEVKLVGLFWDLPKIVSWWWVIKKREQNRTTIEPPGKIWCWWSWPWQA